MYVFSVCMFIGAVPSLSFYTLLLCVCLTTHEPIKATGFLSRELYCRVRVVLCALLCCLIPLLCCSPNYLPSGCACVLTSHEPTKATGTSFLVMFHVSKRCLELVRADLNLNSVK